MWRASEHYPCAPSSPAEARRFVAHRLADALGGRDGATEVIADAELIVSELLTNAVNAQCHRTELVLTARDDRVRIEVHDDARGEPELQRPAVEDEHGRGLVIVAALSADWGVEGSALGKRVWAELALSGSDGTSVSGGA
jgi:anti-sigma regulatory factor (Ser/Thr protein kinase)